jgi:hypothetical protein
VSHTKPDYTTMEGSRISLGYGENDASNTGGESGGEVVNSGRIPHAHVNTVPVQAHRESFTQAFSRGYREGKATLHPWRRWANAIVARGFVVLVLGLIIMVPLPLIGVPMVMLGYASAVVTLAMYLVYPFVLMAWENPNR